LKSLYARILLPIATTTLGGVLLLAVASALWSIQNNVRMIEDYQRREGHLIAEGLANAVAVELVRRNYGEVEARLLQTAASQNVRSALVIDTHGRVLSYVIGRSGDAPAHPDFSLLHATPPSAADHIAEETHPGVLGIWHSVQAGTNIGWVRLEIGAEYHALSMNEMRRQTWMLAMIAGGLGFFLLGAAILRSYRLLLQRETEVEQSQRLLENKAYYDTLTHLPNRSLLFDRFEQAIARNMRAQHLLAVYFLDLDDFKPINDSYGHEAGDRVLVEVSRRLLAAVRGGDTVARLGGDEFIVLVGDLEDEHKARLVAERLLLALNKPMELAGKKIAVHASIGYALHPNDGGDAETLTELADQAMYLAKSAGGRAIRRYRPASPAPAAA